MTTANHALPDPPAGIEDPAAVRQAAVRRTDAGRPMLLPDAPAGELARLLPDGDVCVLGAPGSGKTALLEAVLLRLHGAHGDNAGVLLTPSRQASTASTERLLAGMPGVAAAGLGAATWQHLARELVMAHADMLGYRGEPRILSGAEQWALVRALLAQDGVGEWGWMAPLTSTRGFADELADFVLACERRLLGSEELAARAVAEGVPAWRHAASFLARYTERLAEDEALDHACLVARAGDLLEGSPDLRAVVAARIGTLLVDEAQELDPAQLRLVRLVAAGGARIVLAGDPLGAVEAFRGAVPGALVGHAAALGAAIVLLPASRRLGRRGLAAVRRLQRLDRAGAHLVPYLAALDAPAGDEAAANGAGGAETTTGMDGTLLEVVHAASRTEEAESVAALLQQAHQRDGVPYARMAVLLTHRSQTGPVRHALERFGVPYRVGAGDGSPLEEPIVARVLDLFRLALDPTLAEELLPGLLTSALGGLDPHELRALRRAAVIANQPLSALVQDLPSGSAPAAARPDRGQDPGTDPAAAPGGGAVTGAGTGIGAVARTGAAGDAAAGTAVTGPAAVLSSRIRRRVAALQALRRRAGTWVALEADRCLWELWRAAPAFRRLVRRVESEPAAAASGRQLDALTALSRALTAFVDARPGATIRSWLDLADRAEPSVDPWPLSGTGGAEGITVLGLGAAKGLEVDIAVVVGCLEGMLPRTTWPDGLLTAWRLDAGAPEGPKGAPATVLQPARPASADPVAGPTGEARPPAGPVAGPSPVERARAWLDSERRRFVLAASRARRRAVFTWSQADGHGEPSRFLAEVGLAARPELAADRASKPSDPADPATGLEPCTPEQVVGALRRVLAGTARPRAERVAAAISLARLPAADPASWWWARDWTVAPEPIAPEGRLRTSYTRISVYEDCHLRYFYASVAGLDDRATYRMVFGKLMHTIFELAGTGQIGGDPASLKAAFRERFDPTWFPSRAVAAQYWRDGLAMLRHWYQGEANLAKDALAIEVGFEIDVGGHAIRGRIDRVDRAEDGQGIVLLDYKTARSIPSEAEAARSLQLAIYYLAALRDAELAKLGPPVEMQLVYPAEQRNRRFRRVVQRPDQGHADRVEERLLPLLEGAAAERFEPDPHADCRFCAFKPICPLWPQGEDFLAPAAPPGPPAAVHSGTAPVNHGEGR